MINPLIARTPLTPALDADLYQLRPCWGGKRFLSPRKKLSSLPLRGELERQCFIFQASLSGPLY